MLKSLFSGVAGLQSHQIAMDVESNNISNVNTIGFKYSRANFSDLLAQTNQIATAPQGALGGKNAVQVGLGATVASVTRIHSQGSIQNTDKNTDMAIQGDGFFIVSNDNGNSYKYTRSGDFKFDGNGNFVDNNGFIAQGWLRDQTTGLVDSTAPIVSIVIPPGLTTPANATELLTLKANLNSGNTVESIAPTYAINSAGQAVDDAGVLLNPQPASEDLGVLFNEQGQGFALQQGQGIWVGFQDTVTAPGTAIAAGAIAAFDFDLNGTTINVPALAGVTGNQNANSIVGAINAQRNVTGIVASLGGANVPADQIVLTNDNTTGTTATTKNILVAGTSPATAGLTAGQSTTAYQYTYDTVGGSSTAGVAKTFNTMEDLRLALQTEARNFDGGGAVNNNDSITVEVSPEGRIFVSNPGGSTDGTDDYPISLSVTAFANTNITENVRFTDVMSSLSGTLPITSAGNLSAQSVNAAVHSSSIDIFDSLGSKHTLRMEFRKTDVNATTGTTWSTTLSVPEPATIGTTFPFNEETGSVRFNNDGSLATYSPVSVSFSGNNGSAPNQQVRLDFGTANSFDGMTSFDSASATSGISQDGFTGGDILGIRIDQSGTLVGSFSNGRSFGLAQVALAKFANNEGLTADGGNVYLQTANSGDPIIGEAVTAGRGFIQSSALEASNVDLSRSLTQLIIIQRGYQANGKTITTSDQLLNTLIGLKN